MPEHIIEVVIDNVLTPVDAEDWGSDPDTVIADVRRNRLELRLDEHDTAEAAQAHLDRAEESS